jgi:hypothetical protein
VISPAERAAIRAAAKKVAAEAPPLTDDEQRARLRLLLRSDRGPQATERAA